MTTKSKTGYPIIDDILESIAPSDESPAPRVGKYARWQVVSVNPARESSDVKIVDEDGKRILLLASAQRPLLERFAHEHNQHATLIEQRERLLAALKQVRTMFFDDARAGANMVDGKLEFADNNLHPWIPGARAPYAITIIDNALATIEQETEVK